MPPVFGPESPSNARLWSCTSGMGIRWVPSTNAWSVNSSPIRRSSITAFPFKDFTYSIAPFRSTCSPMIRTPFPPVSPMGLTTRSPS